MRHLAAQIGASVRESDRTIGFPGGGRIEAWTADDPDKLRGPGWDRVILDECRDMNPRAWAEVIRPALMDRKGSAIFISSPRGRDWFYDLWQKGQDPEQPEWASWRFSSYDNPHLDPDELDALDLPERIRRQEILAEFLDEEGEVFRRVAEAATAQPAGPQAGHEYVTFCDLAKVGDYNAVATFRIRDLVQVHADRWNRTDWNVSLERIAAVGNRYPGRLSIDTTGQIYDDAYIRDLRRRVKGCTIGGLKFTAANKEQMVQNLCARLEQSQVTLLAPDSVPAAQVQLYELQDYQAHRLPGGQVRYGAPEGRHDDMATAVMAAVWMGRGAALEPAGDALMLKGII